MDYEGQLVSKVRGSSIGDTYTGQGVVKENSVMTEYGSLQKHLSDLSETVDRLRERLDPVLTPPVPETSQTGNGSVERSMSPFAESVRGDTQRIRNLDARLCDILRRLEV